MDGIALRQNLNYSFCRGCFRAVAQNRPGGGSGRLAMVSMIETGAYSGTTLFGYAHSLFWTPYTIIGDGG